MLRRVITGYSVFVVIEGVSRDQLRLFLCRCQTIKDVTGHRSTWSLSCIESETDFILAQS